MFTPPLKTSTKPPLIFWPLMALVIILAADGATALILHFLPMSPANMFYLAAPAAGLIVGIPAWFRYVVISRHATIKRGVAVGIVGSIIAHPVMWIILSLPNLLTLPNSNEFAPSGWPIFVIYSLIFGGWATTPIGALAGALLIYL